MKKLICALVALASSIAFGATTVPVQMLSPAGSTSGKAIVSSGASSPPAWAAVVNSVAGQTGAVTLTGIGLGTSSSPTFAGLTIAGSANNAVLTGAATGSKPALSATGTDTNVGLNLLAQGSTTIGLGNISGNWFVVTGPTTPANYLRANGATAGSGVVLDAVGSDTNIGISITPKGTGSVTVNGALTTTGTATVPVLTATTGITGRTSGTNPGAGYVGQPINSDVPSGSAISLTSGTPANITSVSLTAGYWLCWGIASFLPNASTVVSVIQAWISTTSATIPTALENGGALQSINATFGTGAGQTLSAGMMTINVSATTTLYLSARSVFTTSTNTAYGFLGCIRLQ